MQFAKVLGFDVLARDIRVVISESLGSNSLSVINTINPHSYVVQKGDIEFEKALHSSDYLLPDGSGIVLAAKLLCGYKLNKIAGFDLFYEVMRQLNVTGGRVFFLGSTDEVLSLISSRASKEFPLVSVSTLSPPYKEKFDSEDVNEMICEINSVYPDVLFVGLTAPKQEKLIQLIKSSLNVRIVSGIGAVFDFYAGTVKRPSKFWVVLHLEWLARLLGEPKRLWRRNFISTPIFLWDILVEKIGFRK